jgi:hypothetical protein
MNVGCTPCAGTWEGSRISGGPPRQLRRFGLRPGWLVMVMALVHSAGPG